MTTEQAIIICSPLLNVCRVKLPMIVSKLEEKKIPYKILDSRDLATIEEMKIVEIHGLPEVKYKERYIFGDISERTLDNLFSEE